jgi:hypothetical protein
MKIQRLKTPIRQAIIVKMAESQEIKTYVERYGYEISDTLKIEALSNLLMKRPYHPILWALYSVSPYLYGYKPPSFKKREICVLDYYAVKEHWLSGSFSDIRDIIAIDNVTMKRPNMAIATLYTPDIQDLTVADSLVDAKHCTIFLSNGYPISRFGNIRLFCYRLHFVVARFWYVRTYMYYRYMLVFVI